MVDSERVEGERKLSVRINVARRLYRRHYVSQEILAIIQTNVPLVRANLLGHGQSRPTIISAITLLSLPFRSIFRPSASPSIFFFSKKMINWIETKERGSPSFSRLSFRYNTVLLKENRDDRRATN